MAGTVVPKVRAIDLLLLSRCWSILIQSVDGASRSMFYAACAPLLFPPFP
jgi:hypothetical protein